MGTAFKSYYGFVYQGGVLKDFIHARWFIDPEIHIEAGELQGNDILRTISLKVLTTLKNTGKVSQPGKRNN